MNSAPERSSSTAAVALAATLAIQVYVALTATATAVLATEIARDFALPAKLVGVFVGVLYVGSMAASLVSGHFIARHGSIRVSQVCVLICATGIGLVALLPAAAAPALAVVPIVIGLGYGFITFAGVVSGPPLFALLAAVTDSYRTGFLFFGAVSMFCGAALLRRTRL